MHYAVITTASDDKLLLNILSKPILYYTIAVFYDHPLINKIIIIVNKKIKSNVEKIIKENFPGNSKDIKIISEGKTREKSILNGVGFIKKNNKIKTSDIIILHDGANPLVTYKEIEACIKKTGKEYLKMPDKFPDVKYIPSNKHNFKIITPDDYNRAKQIMGDIPEDFIFGIGQESHDLSDNNVTMHALYNAILQAIGEKSLGAFGDDSCEFKNIKDSKKYLKTLLSKAKKKGYSLNHLGFMIECKKNRTDEILQKTKHNIKLLTGLRSKGISITIKSGKKNQCLCVASLKAE